MPTVHTSHITAGLSHAAAPHILPRSFAVTAPRPKAAAGSTTIQSTRSQRSHSGDSLPLWKWGVTLLLVGLGGFGVSKLLASSDADQDFDVVLVQIKVLVKGKPAPGAVLTLTSIRVGDEAASRQLVGRDTVDSNSLCSPRLSGDKPGVPAGEYVASLTWSKVEVKDGETIAGPDRIQELYRSPATSPLRVTVPVDSKSPITLQVADPKGRSRTLRYDPE